MSLRALAEKAANSNTKRLTDVKTEPVAEPKRYDWTKDRPQITETSLPVDLKHKQNLKIEALNTASRETTWRHKVDPTRYHHLGAPITPLYAYSDEERTVLLHDKSLDWNTLPAFLRAELALRAADEAASPAERLALNWAPEPFTVCGDGEPLLRPVPQVYRAMLLAGCHIPLTWFSDVYMTLAGDLSRLATKDITLLSKTNKPMSATIIDVDAMIQRGWPDEVLSFGPPYKLNVHAWRCNFENLLRVCTSIAEPVDAADGNSNITTELRKHFAYFSGLPGADQRFDDWYPTELQLRGNIFSKRAFSYSVWDSMVSRSALMAALDATHARNAAMVPPPHNPGHHHSKKRRR
ncbi:hypothetical protein EV714DRAFT_276755 [Schizophyllum commune]